jgi:hypothetical protein
VSPLEIHVVAKDNDDDDDDTEAEDALREALANWRRMVLEADSVQEAGFFPSGGALDSDTRARRREQANTHWTRYGPRLRLLEQYIQCGLRARPKFFNENPDGNVQFFVQAVFQRNNTALRHLYRGNRKMSRSDSDC